MTNYDVTTADVTKMGYIYIFLKFQYSGDEWPIKIFNCSQNFTFARFACKI